MNKVNANDIVHIISFMVPSLNNSSISMRVKKSLVTKSGDKQFTVLGNNFKQSDVGLVLDGMLYDSRRIIVTSDMSLDEQILHAKKVIESEAEQLKVKTTNLLRDINENLKKLDINAIEVVDETYE